jgi:hypothetical protein
MDAAHHDTSAIPSATTPEDDPKPVYAGDWRTATGTEKGRHAEAVRQWKLRNGIAVGGRMGARSSQPVPHQPAPDAATPAGTAPSGAPSAAGDAASRSVLVAIRDNPQAHDSDRIRAVQQLAALDRGEVEEGGGTSDLVALRSVLETLAPHERLAWLQGERMEGIAQGGSAAVAAGA